MNYYFAIQHIATGHFLPSGKERGQTQLEPRPMTLVPPRLFTTRRGAQQALNWWLKGIVSVTRRYDDDETWHTDPMPQRSAEAMRVVEVKLEVAQ